MNPIKTQFECAGRTFPTLTAALAYERKLRIKDGNFRAVEKASAPETRTDEQVVYVGNDGTTHSRKIGKIGNVTVQSAEIITRKQSAPETRIKQFGSKTGDYYPRMEETGEGDAPRGSVADKKKSRKEAEADERAAFADRCYAASEPRPIEERCQYCGHDADDLVTDCEHYEGERHGPIIDGECNPCRKGRIGILIEQRDLLFEAAKAWQRARADDGISMADLYEAAWKKTDAALQHCCKYQTVSLK